MGTCAIVSRFPLSHGGYTRGRDDVDECLWGATNGTTSV